MSIENEIRKLFYQGYTPQQLIQMGYKKSTVYKVYQSLRTYVGGIRKPNWSIKDIWFNHVDCRYLPGQEIILSFYFENSSNMDIYLNKIGVHIEWLKPDGWYVQNVRDLIKSGQRRQFYFRIPIPENIPLGEYELRFGIEGQYLPILGYQSPSLHLEWSEPTIIHIKYPLTGIKIFISHSVRDIQLIRQLEQQLDNYGIEAIIAEDIQTPGMPLREKFEQKIREATIFLVLFTENSIRSKWVLEETAYAIQIGKPIIPLKEKNLPIQLDIEWIEFSRDEKPDELAYKIFGALKSHFEKTPLINPYVYIIGAAIIAFLGGFLGGFFASSFYKK